ncbi:MAG TPA: hypothetical protein VLB89_05820 [Gaiellaceae bacterium]|nr:hypothetical protein [Gaiellaceae bacterium]
MLTTALVMAAFVAGIAGTWSPCGLSMIETISGPRRHVGLCCLTFALGAVAGGTAAFGALAALGGLVDAHGLALVAVLGVAAAIADVRGRPIVPQIRRQVPERWRRVLPLPVATLLYGVLLGLGFTTFVYAVALWALAGIAFVVASPQTGALMGLAFGVGRALPICMLAPVAHRRVGRSVVDAMAQRPVVLALVRRLAAACLVVVAAAALVADARGATWLGPGTDPSASGTTVVWTSPAGGVARDEGTAETRSVPPHATVGGSLIAWRDGDTVHVAQLADLSPVVDLTVPGVTAVAVSDTWLVTRAGNRLEAHSIAEPETVARVATTKSAAQLGRPALDGDLLVYHVAMPRFSTIVAFDLATATRRTVRKSKTNLLTNPSLLGGELLYDRQTSRAQLVELGPLGNGARDRAVYRLAAPSVHDAGHEQAYSHHTRNVPPRTAKWRLWTTALSGTQAYVTLLPRTGAAGAARLLSLPR